MAIPEAEHPLSERELGTWFALLETVDTIRDLLAEQLQDGADLTLAQFGILGRLAEAPGGTLRMTDIADGLVASRSGTTYQVGRLADRGLVERHASQVDERSVEVTITAEGRRRLERLRPAHERMLQHLLFQKLDAHRLDELAGLLEEVREHLREAPPRSVRRRAGRALRDDAEPQ